MSKKTPKSDTPKKTSIGGQALIEGIMMRGPEVTSMAVRHIKTKEIVLEQWPTSGQNKKKWMKIPIIRGVINMAESMIYGYKCLMKSADLSGIAELEEEEKAKKDKRRVEALDAEEAIEPALEPETIVGDDAHIVPSDQPEPVEKPEDKSKGDAFLMAFITVISSVLGIVLALALFMYLPTYIYSLVKNAAPVLKDSGYHWLQGVFESVLRMVLFIAYISATALLKDIKRVYRYHGAEHKTIFCYEYGEGLTVENVRKQIRFHPRCGTSFLVLMLIVGMFVSLLIPVYTIALRVFIKILCFPIVVGIGYELIKLAGRTNNLFTRIISAPGLWVQRITTKEPDDSMIEVAIKAMNAVIPADPELDKW